MVTKRILLCTALIGLSGCSLDKQAAPAMTGPSELGLSLNVTATPDIITQDGASQATVIVHARDAHSQDKSGVTLRIQTYVGGVPVDFGVLSSKTVSTGSDGRASVTYTAPPAPPLGDDTDKTVDIAVVPVGTNFDNALTRHIAIRLLRPGVFQPPNGTPTADFTFSPTQPRENEWVLFDGAPSSDSDGRIVAWAWKFGDGRSATGVSPVHSYDLAGEYVVTLTVTDDRGLTAEKRATITVGTAANPVANFTFSPQAPKVNTNVFFNAASSTVPTGREIIEYSWEFGDGGIIEKRADPTIAHPFGSAGTFTVTLTVTDNTGRKSVKSLTVTILP